MHVGVNLRGCEIPGGALLGRSAGHGPLYPPPVYRLHDLYRDWVAGIVIKIFSVLSIRFPRCARKG